MDGELSPTDGGRGQGTVETHGPKFYLPEEEGSMDRPRVRRKRFGATGPDKVGSRKTRFDQEGVRPYRGKSSV